MVSKSKNIAGEFIFINIGQMIEFLINQGQFGMEMVEVEEPNCHYIWELSSNDEWIEIGARAELCDVLWEAIKEILVSQKIIFLG